MTPLKNGNNRDNCSGDVTHEQSIDKQISYRSYKRVASFNGYFLKEDFLDQLLDLFDFQNISYERKVGLALYKLSENALSWWEQPNGYNLIEPNKVNTKFVHGPG